MSGVQLRQFEQVVDQAGEVLDFQFHVVEIAVGGLRVGDNAVDHGFDHRADRGDGRAQVVRGLGDQIAPLLIEPALLLDRLPEGWSPSS